MKNFSTLILLYLFSTLANANNIAFLDKATINKLQNSVFEIVTPKKENPQIIYEKDLPLHLLSHRERNEKFHSIGTAFFINERQLMSAAHVFILNLYSQLNDFHIRDKHGKTYKIGKVHRYSMIHDMIVFDLISYPENPEPLSFSSEPHIGDTVFSVGNAQGEGVSFRAGQVASFTQESEYGLWNDIRFTSPASPGNSGGPLVDINGDVVGLIVKRNTSENHNIAVPIEEHRKLDNTAIFFVRNNIISLFEEENSLIRDWRYETDLPMEIHTLSERAISNYDNFYKVLADDTIKKYQDSYFPTGERFRSYLRDQNYVRQFGVLDSDIDFNNWSVSNHQSKTIPIAADQKLTISKSDISSMHIVIEKPSEASLQHFLDNQVLFMDTLLKGFPLTRQIGAEKIRIKSLGKPESTHHWADSLGRKWTSSLWLLPHINAFIYSHCLPYPGGQICNLDLKNSYDLTFSYMQNIKDNYQEITIGYEGEISDWSEYFRLDKDKLPSFFNNASISLENNLLNINLDDYTINFNDELLNENSNLHFHFGYSNHQLLAETLLLFEVFPQKGSKNHYRVQQYYQPTDFNDDRTRSRWDDLKKSKGIFTGDIVNNGTNFLIRKIAKTIEPRTPHTFNIESYYVLGCSRETSDNNMKSECNNFFKSISFPQG